MLYIDIFVFLVRNIYTCVCMWVFNEQDIFIYFDMFYYVFYTAQFYGLTAPGPME